MTKRRKPNRWNTKAQSLRQLECAIYSFCINRPVNYFLTIHLGKAGVEPSAALDVQSHFLKLGGEWLRRRTRRAPVFIWQLENPALTEKDGKVQGGLNLHVLIHVPRHLQPEFKSRAKAWIELAGGQCRARVIHGNPVESSGAFDDRFDFVSNGILGAARYMLKGTDPSACRELGIADDEKRDQGVISGKRCGYSESLSPKSRVWSVFPLARYPKIKLAGPELRRRTLAEAAEDTWLKRKGWNGNVVELLPWKDCLPHLRSFDTQYWL